MTSSGSIGTDVKHGTNLNIHSAKYYLISCGCVFSCFVDFEIVRQVDILEAGGEVVNETRAFNIDTG